MKRLLYVSALALALLPGLAIAQNITRSLQGSQDPRGPVGMDPSNSAYFPGHVNPFGPTTVPSLTVCGASAVMASGSTDNAGHWAQVNGTSCIVVFNQPFNAPPNCIVTTSATSPAFVAATTTTSFLVTGLATAISVYYVCLSSQ